ncbi:unnamed protein product [Didymodactylos carnosus]|uniref:NAD(P)(+)--arginine ADP-ribosyltransferase n=1 Tax=Didymodactylos carnosus TaxID=1234261 RepID=A0A814XZ79_9BILA|nr:unnamed protein product [Didymodactylos carnosus]CAF3985612.1 unnamed protein product [Didymodactylos carnosus]
MPSLPLLPIPNDAWVDVHCGNAEFVEIHLDKRYYVGENITLHQVVRTENNRIGIKGNYKLFWDPDQCIDFITSYEWRKVFISLTDGFSYLLPLIHDLSQIVFIYIYSSSPAKVSYSSADYTKLRAIVNENSPDTDKQLLSDIEMFRRDLMPINVINPIRRKTKLLIQEPLPVDKYLVVWIQDEDDSTRLDTLSITDIINYLEVFFNIEQCINYIKSLADDTKIFFISSHSDTETVLKEVAHLSNVISIYLFDNCQQIAVTLNDSNIKVRGRYSDIQSLANQLFQEYKSFTHSSEMSVSVFDREKNEKTVRDLSKESARFLWLQLLVDILIKTPYNDQTKDEMLDECRIHYKDSAIAQKAIEEFDKTYKSTEALQFYTKDSFLYRLFNRALRTENIDFLFIFRFFLADMYHQLQKLHSEQFSISPRYTGNMPIVYRGQSMTVAEFDHIKNNVGRLISVSTFFSTTENYNMAVIYSGSEATNREPESVSVIFEIEMDLIHDATKRPFASIKHLSRFPEECEVLFSVGSTFRILSAHDKRTSEGHWHVKMKLVEDDNDISELRNDLEIQYSQHNNLCDLGLALIAMCDYDRAERYCRRLLEYLPESNPSIGYIHESLGVIFANRGDYRTALNFQEKALEVWTKFDLLGQNLNSLSRTYVHIGAAYRHLGQLDLALKYCLMAADMQSPTESLAFAYNEIAITHRDKGDNRLALEYFLKSLHVEEQVLKLTKYHPKLATTYNNIGEIYVHLGDDENALKYLEHALNIRLKGTVSTHTDLAATYHNLGNVYQRKSELKKALEMYQKALEIDTRIFHDNHELLAGSHSAIAMIHRSLGDLTNAVYHAEKGLRILLRSQAKDNRSLVVMHQQNLGFIQYQLGNTTKALKMAEKALQTQLTCVSEAQGAVARTYDLFSCIYEKEGDISKALEYSEKAVEQAKIWAMRNRTFELEYFLSRLDTLKNTSSSGDSKFPTSFTSAKVWCDDVDVQDHVISKSKEELEQTPANNILKRLELLNNLIVMHSRKKNFSMASKCFDEANIIYTEHQTSDVITKEQLENEMITVFHNTALVYHRQQDWNMCSNMLGRSLDLVLQQKEEHRILPEIYYCMASSYAHRQEIHMAIYYYELAISTARKRLLDDHPDMQRYCFQLQLYKTALSEAYSKRQFNH